MRIHTGVPWYSGPLRTAKNDRNTGYQESTQVSPESVLHYLGTRGYATVLQIGRTLLLVLEGGYGSRVRGAERTRTGSVADNVRITLKKKR